MNRSSPAVRRIAAILDFMADHPTQAFTMTDLVRALKLSRATCHALLTGLVEVGYLYRTSEKSYVLGPALAAIGRASAENFSPLQVTQPELRRLADEYDVVAAAVAREGDTVLVRERATSLSHVAYPIPLGSRLQLRTPFAAAFLAWSQEDAESWLASPARSASEDQREAFREGIAFARDNGFLAMVRNPALSGFDGPAEQIFAGDTNEFPVSLITSLDLNKSYEGPSLVAPVFNAKGKVEFVIVMMGFKRTMTGRKMLEAAERLKIATKRITSFMGGTADTV